MSTSEVLFPQILNQTMTLADTEYPITFPTNTKYFSIQSRDGTAFRWAFVTGKVAASTAPFATIRASGAYNTPEKVTLPPNITTLYVGCADAGKIVELIAWTSTAP